MTNSLLDNDIDHSIYFELCNSMRDGVAVINATNRKFVYCNNSFLNLFGIDSLNEIDLTLLKKLTNDTITPDIIAEREKTIREKGSYYELVEYKSLKGHSFFGEATVQLLNKKAVDYYLFAIAPIENAFFEVASMGMLMVNKMGEIVTINQFALQQFGYQKKEVIGKKIEMLIPSHLHQIHVEHREKFMHQPQNRRIGLGTEVFAIRKDGNKFPVEISLGNYATDGHQYIIAFISDISIRKQAEDKLKRLNEELEFKVEHRTQDLKNILRRLEKTNDKLEEASTLQKVMFNSAGVIIISSDKNGIIQTFNREAEKELGYKAEELVRKKSPLVFHDINEVSERAEQLSKELHEPVAADMAVFLAKSRLGLHNEYECTLIRKDGSRFPVLLTVNELKDTQNAIIGFLGIAINITKIKKAEIDLIESLKKERELNELKSRFVSMASHEFRTPLSTVLSSAYLIEKYPSTEDHPKRRRHLERIVSSVNMLTDILNDFLSMGKIEEGKIHLNLSHFNLPELIKSVLDEMKDGMQNQQNIHFYHEGDPEVFLDTVLLKHIVMNLVSNADKFSPPTKPIEITTLNHLQQIILSVKDHGMGISKEDQPHLMERFFRGANAANIQGTGLGLHIVSKYAELMNGNVECKSELEKGTELIITFKNKIEPI